MEPDTTVPSVAQVGNFFDGDEGRARNFMKTRLSAILDLMVDGAIAFDRRRALLGRLANEIPRQRVLVVGIEVPGREEALRRVCKHLSSSRHDVSVSTIRMQPKGKFANIDDAIAASSAPLNTFGWLVIVDDDVKLPRRFTDRYLAAASVTNLTVSQPAHRFLSYASYELTRRRPGSIVRQTSFVEIGPMTVLRRECFEALIPFPPSRWAYGIDVLWAAICKKNNWRMGVVDAMPLRHLRPVGASYDIEAAINEGRELLVREGVQLTRADILGLGRELFSEDELQRAKR